MSSQDKSDQKSLINLIETLNKLPKSPSASQNSTKLHSPQASTQTRKSTRRKYIPSTVSPVVKRRRFKENDKNKKITEFFNKENFSANKAKPLDITVNKKESKKKKTLVRSSSTEKYGIEIPTYEKIIQDQKKLEEYKTRVKALDVFDDAVLDQKFNTDCLNNPEKFTDELLDCKKLSEDALQAAFYNHIDTLKSIMNGTTYSERHQTFTERKYRHSAKDLTSSTSLVVFKQEQIDYLLKLMSDELDPEDKKIGYFFKVLLPELCLRIFMNTHKMNKKDADRYLDNRPVDT